MSSRPTRCHEEIVIVLIAKRSLMQRPCQLVNILLILLVAEARQGSLPCSMIGKNKGSDEFVRGQQKNLVILPAKAINKPCRTSYLFLVGVRKIDDSTLARRVVILSRLTSNRLNFHLNNPGSGYLRTVLLDGSG